MLGFLLLVIVIFTHERGHTPHLVLSCGVPVSDLEFCDAVFSELSEAAVTQSNLCLLLDCLHA